MITVVAHSTDRELPCGRTANLLFARPLPDGLVTRVCVTGDCATRTRRLRRCQRVALVLARRLPLLEWLQVVVLGYDQAWALASRTEPACGPGVGCAWAMTPQHFRTVNASLDPTNIAVARPLGVPWEATLGPPVAPPLAPPQPPAHPLDPLATSQDHAVAACPRPGICVQAVVARIPCSAECAWLSITARADLRPIATTIPEWNSVHLKGTMGTMELDYMHGRLRTAAATLSSDWWFDRCPE